MQTVLPIDAVIPKLIEALREQASAVLLAPPGAGKTTRVPPATIDHGLAGTTGKVLVLQPRRVAARSVSRRMAEERSEKVGETIGYHIRFERKAGHKTRVLVMTDGVLIRLLQSDPFLEDVSIVIFDEFHERHLESDLGLAMCRRIQQTVRPDLKLLVMSATLDATSVASYLGQCPVIECEVPRFPVHIIHDVAPASMPLPMQIARSVERLLSKTAGDILAFLPGVREIRQAEVELKPLAERRTLKVLPLFGDLSAEEQDRIFEQSSNRRVILATNIAETSITIPGVSAVIDSGLARVMEFDACSGLNRLELKQISQASADQRAGRAGRTGPGHCLRLWPETAHRHRSLHETPEIHRVDLSGVVLQLLDWGETDVHSFPWFEQPGTQSLISACAFLEQIDATSSGAISSIGRRMACIPLEPRLSRLLMAVEELSNRINHSPALQRQSLQRATLLVSVLSERDPFQRLERRGPARLRSRSDILDRVDALMEFDRSRRLQFDIGNLNRGSAEHLLRTANQIERILATMRTTTASQESATSTSDEYASIEDVDELLMRSLLAAYPDRLVRRREPGGRRGIMVGGRGVKLSDESAVTEGELFLALDIDDASTEAFVRLASCVDRTWLPINHQQTRIDIEFDEDHERLQARRRITWFDLILEESPTSLPDLQQVAEELALHASRQLSRVVPFDNPTFSSFLARVRSLRLWLPDLNLPDFGDDCIREVLPDLCLGCRSFADLRMAPWLDVLSSRLSPYQRQILDREAPEKITVPSGSHLAIQYEPGRPPVLAVRIQEVFGWKKTPRIAAGRIPLLLHLLAPNHRPQQITDDLESFWKNGYPIIRGELRRRYPKHSWPDDPLTASAERRPQRRSSSQE